MHGQLSYIFSPQFTEPVVVPGLSGVGFALSPSPTCLDPGRVSTALAWILRYVRSLRVVLLTFAAELSLHYRPSMDGEFYFYILVKRRLMPCADHPDSSGNERAREFRAKKKEKQPFVVVNGVFVPRNANGVFQCGHSSMTSVFAYGLQVRRLFWDFALCLT